MQYLNDILLSVNTKLSESITTNHFSAGLVRLIVHKDKNVNEDMNHKPIYFDDKYTMYFYHKLNSLKTIQQKSSGIINRYKNEANLTLYVFSKIDADEYFQSKLVEIPECQILEVDYDHLKIMRQETQVDSNYDFKKFVFAINYLFSFIPETCVAL